jgi:hypothetical protein
MSKERARRRAEREAAAASARERRGGARPGPAGRARPNRPAAARTPRRRPASRLTARRRRQDGVLLGALLAGHVALWLLTDRWAWRLGALVLTVLAWPVLVTVFYDRRPGQG